MEEFVAYGMHPLATGVGFDKVATLVTPVLKLKLPLLKFVAVHKDDEDDVQCLARVELEAKGIMGSYTHPEHEACVMSLHNEGHLNMVFELAEMAYGPRPEPGTKEFTKASKKRKMDVAGKNLSKRVRALKKKKVETVKAAVPPGKTYNPQGKGATPRGKGGLKRLSDVEVASARPVKQTKKTMFRPTATATVVGTVAVVSESKVATGMKRTAMPTRKPRVPAFGVMVEASSTESQESSPHGLTAQDSLPKNVSMPEPHGLSPRASVPDIMPSAEPRASLQITTPAGWLVTLLLSFVLFCDVLSFVACVRCL
jgi:hypothetical protein